MSPYLQLSAEEPVRTVVLDGLSLRDIALGAALALLLVLLVMAIAGLRDKNQQRRADETEGGGRQDELGGPK